MSRAFSPDEIPSLIFLNLLYIIFQELIPPTLRCIRDLDRMYVFVYNNILIISFEPLVETIRVLTSIIRAFRKHVAIPY